MLLCYLEVKRKAREDADRIPAHLSRHGRQCERTLYMPVGALMVYGCKFSTPMHFDLII
jgi:hypothetical protein